MKGFINWFADNPIAANLLMMLLLIGGLGSVSTIDKEIFPPFTLDLVRITVPYPGAGPVEVEQQICIRIEEALEGLEGIFELRCVASTNLGQATVEVAGGFSFDRVLNAIKARVDSISTFPAVAERAVVEEVRFSQRVAGIAVAGDADERSLKEFTESLRENLAANPLIPLARTSGTRAYEVAIEIPEAKLREYGLSLEILAQRIAAHSLTVGGGLIRTGAGDIQIQVRQQAYSGDDFGRIPIISSADGASILLRDIAEIRDGFVEDEILVRFNGQRAAFINILVTENPDILRTTKAVYAFVEEARKSAPQGVSLTIWQDSSIYYRDRLNTLQRSGLAGLVLVFVSLLLFLRPAIAVWVTMGIAVSFISTLFVLPFLGTSLNIITLFAFILVLGIVVDDAIIIGENIHRAHGRGLTGVHAAKVGTLEVASPVLFAVTTSIIVFIPMLFLPGDLAAFMVPIATVPILALFFSLVESLLILPAHLSHLRPEQPAIRLHGLNRLRERISDGMDRFLVLRYRPYLRYCLHHRLSTVAIFAGLFILITSLYIGGIVRFSAMPQVPVEYVRAEAKLQAGTPFEEMERIANQLESAAERALEVIERERDESIRKNLYVTASGNWVDVVVELTSAQTRRTESEDFVTEWRSQTGPIPSAEEFQFTGQIDFGGTADIEFRLDGRDLTQLAAAADWVAAELQTYGGIYDVRHSLHRGRPEMEISPSPLATALGVNPAELAQQVRRVFFGEEIQRVPRLREDVRVMVRYPEQERSSTALLADLMVRTSDGRQIPFDSLAHTEFVEGYADITRINGLPTISVSADFRSEGAVTAQNIVTSFFAEKVPALSQQFPGVRLVLEGEQAENREFYSALIRLGLLAIVAIYGLLAIQFRSLSQPLIILAAIPFGFAGAVLGHLFTGQTISMLSLMGVLAAAGVIVNDTLILIHRANSIRANGFSATHAIVQAGRDRFRPIFLTSLTTFAGLAPLLLERSTQARFLIPMATSLSAGVLAATVVTLVMVPCLYSISEQLRERVRGPRSY